MCINVVVTGKRLWRLEKFREEIEEQEEDAKGNQQEIQGTARRTPEN